MSEDRQKEFLNINIPVDQIKVIPKFCTNVQATIINNNVVLTFVYNEGYDGKPSGIIDRIVVDSKHCKELEDLFVKINNTLNGVTNA